MDTLKYTGGEDKDFVEQKEGISQKNNQSKILPYIRLSLMAIMMMADTGSIKSDGFSQKNQTSVISKNTVDNGNIERLGAYEAIFKDGIRKALDGLNNICQIPKGGKIIEYFRDDTHPTLAGKKMSPQAVKGNNLPETFDISPREFNGSLSSMNFHLGNRTFNIEPWVGKIQHVYLNSEELTIETTFKNIIYDKEKELPRLMFKLRRTPPKKGKKEGFKGSTVTEI